MTTTDFEAPGRRYCSVGLHELLKSRENYRYQNLSTAPNMPWLSRVQQSHDRDEDRGREEKEHKKPCANQPTPGDLAVLLVHLQVTMIIADLGRRWMWAHAPLRDWCKDGRRACVAKDGVAVGQAGFVIALRESVSPDAGASDAVGSFRCRL
jgi:hypothetical protein